VKKYLNYLYSLALSSTAKSTYITTSAAGVNAFLSFIFWVVIARSLSPSELGLFSVVFNFISILYVICDIGISSSILRFLPQAIRDAKSEEESQIIKVSFLVSLGASGIVALGLILFSAPLSDFVFVRKELSFPFIISSFSLIGFSLSYLFVTILQGRQKFLFAALAESSIIFFKVLLTGMLLLSGRLNFNSILFIFSLSSFVGFLIGLPFISLRFLSAKGDITLLKTLFNFGIWVALARIANAASGRIDSLMLVRFVEASQIGFYTAAQRVTFIFPLLVGGVSVVLSPKFSSLKDPDEAKSFMIKSSLLMSSLFFLVLLLFVFAPWLVVVAYGEIYQPAVFILRILLVSSFFFIASSIPTTVLLYYLGESKIFTLISIFQLVLIFLGDLILIPRVGVLGPAVSLSIAYAVVFFLSLLFVFQRFREK